MYSWYPRNWSLVIRRASAQKELNFSSYFREYASINFSIMQIQRPAINVNFTWYYPA